MSSRVRAMVALGIQVEQAKAILGGTIVNGATASGSAATDAYAIVANVTLFTTTASSTGAILPSTAEIYDVFVVGNGGSNTLKIYPHTGGKINNSSTDAAVSVATLKGAYLQRISATDWVAVYA